MNAETGCQGLVSLAVLIHPRTFCTLHLASPSFPQLLSRLGSHDVGSLSHSNSVQVYTGMQWWEILTHRGPITQWALPVWKTWLPVRLLWLLLWTLTSFPLCFKVLFVAYFGGYILLPRQFQMEQAAAGGAYGPVPTEISNGQGQSTPLLAEEHETVSSWKVQLSDYYGHVYYAC